jgi:hypothetical protein
VYLKEITAALCARSIEDSTILIISFLKTFNYTIYAANKRSILICDEYESAYKLVNDGYLGVASHAHWSIFAFFQLVLIQELNAKIFTHVVNPLRHFSY